MSGGAASHVAVKTIDLVVRYAAPAEIPVTALDQISVRVLKGESVALVGPDGAGKTTFLRALAGIVPLAAGGIWIDGQCLLTARQRALAGVQLVDDAPLGSRLDSVAQFLGTGLCPPAEVAELLHFCGLWECRSTPVAQLALRHQRALALGRALCIHPRLLLLDEPILGLTPPVADRICAALQAAARRGATTILATSQLDIALQTCDRLILLADQRVVYDASTAVIQRLLTRHWYGIRVLGHLGEEWTDWLAGFHSEHEPGGTMRLIGSLPDQSALYGLLARIGALGLTLIDVRRLTPELSLLRQYLVPGQGTRVEHDQT